MSQGGCLCGNVRIEADVSSPGAQVICSCTDCRKISGSTFSTNLIIPEPKVIKGSPKTYHKTADSGKGITSFFCSDCGSTVFRTGESFAPMAILKVGVMDDQSIINAAKPQAELYAKRRVDWLPSIPGVELKQTA